MGQTSASVAGQSRDYHGRFGGGDKGGDKPKTFGAAVRDQLRSKAHPADSAQGDVARFGRVAPQHSGAAQGSSGGSGGGSAGAAHQKGVHKIGHTGAARGGVSKNVTVREHTAAHLATDARHFPDRAGKSGYRK
jgi:hypothetical protein